MGQYRHLTTEERENIFGMKIKDYSIRKIAAVLNRSISTISRELKRNVKANSLYSPSQATENYRKKRKKCRRRKLLEDKIIKEKVQYLFLHQQWSPEQISNRLQFQLVIQLFTEGYIVDC